MKKRLLTVISVIIFVISASRGYTADQYEWKQNYNWKLTHEGAKDVAEDIFANIFAKLVHERSNGHITIDDYYMTQLGTSTDQIELLQGGAVEFGIAAIGSLAAIVPEVGVLSLHYLLPAEISKVWDFLANSSTTAELSRIIAEHGIQILCWNTEGAHVWSMKKPINSLADMKGVKFRTMASQLEMASFNAYGASSTTIAFAELYSALQLGTVDGQQQNAQGNNVLHYYEVAPYYINARASYYIDAPCCNKSFYDSLDPYIKELLAECAQEAREQLIKIVAEKDEKEARDIARANGVTWIDFNEAQRAEFAAAAPKAYGVYLEIGGKHAKELLDMCKKDAEKYKN